MFFITFIFFFVLVVLGRTLYYFSSPSIDVTESRAVVHGTAIEIIWTVVPSLILVVVALPSFALLYSIDEVIDPAVTIKCVGHQWYWSYEYSDFDAKLGTVNFDSYMIPEDELELGELRLLEVDNRVVLPVNLHVRVLVTAADVLHSWAVPSLGIKVDACTGRLNQTTLFVLRDGVFFGQCSEICWRRDSVVALLYLTCSWKSFVSSSVTNTSLRNTSWKKHVIINSQRCYSFETFLAEYFNYGNVI